MAGRFRFTGSRKGKLPYLDLVTRLARRLFRITYRGDFWLAIGTSGDVVVVQRRRVFPGYFFHTDDAFGRSHVRQRRSGDDIPDGVNAFYAGIEIGRASCRERV